MSSVSIAPVVPVLTPEQQGVFFDVVKRNTPSWLLAASDELRRELYASLMASHRSKSEADTLLEKLESPESFCVPLLAKAMSDRLGMPLDVSGVVFQHIRSTSSLLGLRKKLVLPIDRDLLTAACENFELSETLPANYHDTSLIYIPEKITGRAANLLSIKPHEFAALCRKLDLGKHYQAHLQTVFEPDAPVSELRNKCITHSQDCFEVDRHVALMKKQISPEVHQMLKSVKNNTLPIKLGNNTLGYQGLKLLDVMINGAMFIGPVSEHDDGDYRCVVYLPDDPLHPLKAYASFRDFEMELSSRLKDSAFRQFFMRYISIGDRLAFLTELDSRLFPRSTSPLPQQSTYVSFVGVDFDGDPFTRMYRQRVAQSIADARLMVVPTDDEDEKTRLARLETYKTIGLDLILVAVSFLPVVGEVLLALTAVQLLAQVYEGIASWSRGEKEQATDYLFDVIENLILMAAFAAGTAAVGKSLKTVRASGFIKGLRTVNLTVARTRLWKPDLTAYHQRRIVPRALATDDRGLRWMDGRAYLSIDNYLYAVRPKPATDLWEVLQPNGAADGYTPLLETNGEGAWRHDSELTQAWDGLTLFRRFGFSHNDLPDVTARKILAVCGIEDGVLRQAHTDRRSPPALLIDTVRRFRADAAVTRFIEQMQAPSTAALADPDLQLHLLTALRTWPGDSAVSVVNVVGEPLTVYGSSTAARTLRISQDALDKGQWHTPLLSALDNVRRESLLGETIDGSGAQVKKLLQIIAELAESKRLELFNRVYQRTEVPSNARVSTLLGAFVDLPTSVAEELVRNATTAEWAELDAAKVPLRLAEEARRYAQVVRVSRAYEGLYLNDAGGYYTHCLVLDTLKHLPGWSDNLRVQILEWTASEGAVASIGATQASEKLLINALADRYSVFEGHDGPLTTFAGRTREHYFQALWHGLPAQYKATLGVQVNDAGALLREKITRLALQRRTAIEKVIDAQPPRPDYTSPMGLADRPVAQPGTATVDSTDVLVRRAQELYPMHSPAQIQSFLTTLGANDVLALKKLEALRLEFLAIREALSRWVTRQTWHQPPEGPRLQVSRQRKLRATRAIIRSWRKDPGLAQAGEGPFSTLALVAGPLGELPVIVGNFDHVDSLVLNGVGASAGLNTFLHNFRNLRSLSLSGNHLTRLPVAMERMPALAHLDLSDNRIQLTAESVTQLEGMTGLQTLNLDRNSSLSHVLDVSKLLRLEQLSLRDTGIDQWPRGASGLSSLRLLDMRDNQIKQLPEEVFEAPLALNRGINVYGNPLSPDTLKQVATYQQNKGVHLGVTASDYRRPPEPTVTEADQSALWLAGISLTESLPRRTLWESMLASPGSGDFFNVLSRLRETADFKRIYSHFSQRVWNVLEAAAEDDRLRRSLFRMARVGRVSVDGYSALFSEMEMQVLCFQAMAAATTGVAALEQQLINLLRGLFRLQEVEGLALADINTRSAAEPTIHEHAPEVSLAYRVRLAERLDLPSQPRGITTRWNVEIHPATLDRMYQEVLTKERTSAWPEWINQQGFWVEYLEASHRDQFEAVTDRAAQAFAQLEGQVELSQAVAAERMNGILQNFKNERRALIKQLTSQALMRNPVPDS